ncbi:MAG: Z1 domain-containing protein [Actinobacteria bacterium]|nr:Z1 domain-containing protein [Actinomycetota bacterium]
MIGADAEFIVQRCILAEPDESDEEGAASRERRGAVMGAVQSGKTASMLAVIAKSLDAGVDAVVVLGGTQTALWLQTWERLLGQLDTLKAKNRRRVILPAIDPSGIANGAAGPGLYVLNANLVTRALDRDRPIIVVAMKQVAHLERVARTLREVVYPAVESIGRPYHLLVVDDEADDSSIDESDLTGDANFQERQVPRRIVDLWESRQLPGETAIPELRVTYLAYTATPQANFLQDQSNPLAPKDFVVCLRTPGAEGDADARDPGFRVPEGITGWYTGGDVYYKTLSSVPLCVPVDELPEEEAVAHAVRGYMVASGIRLARAGGTPSPAAATHQVYSTAAEAKAAGGPVMSMLVHPSAAMGAHFSTAYQLLEWSAGLRPGEGVIRASDGDWSLGTAGILADMDDHPERWTQWLEDYVRSNEAVGALDEDGPEFPDIGWEQLKHLILDEIVPVTSVAVINSDVRAADRPVFEPVRRGDGWRTAPNLSTIFVSGNVMSRGLTLDGLTTTLFTRRAEDPASDTQMQMQRWFGYRGSFIDVCRVLMAEQQIALFTEYHETDLALRIQVLDAMSADSPAPPTVLQGRTFKATGKVRNVRGRGLWPGHEPFTTWLNSPDLDVHNQKVVANLFQEPAASVPGESGDRGLLLDRSLTMVEVADLLNMLRYPAGSDGAVDPDAQRHWAAVQTVAQLGADDPLSPIYAMPTDTDPAVWGTNDPFNVAAYLKFWALCLERRCPAVFSTDEPPQRWSTIDLSSRALEAPAFRVGLRFGSGDPVQDGPLSEITATVRGMRRAAPASRLKGTWGSRTLRDGVMWGDEFFDCYPSGKLPRLTQSRARERGSDGLLLFHVIHRDGGGVSIAPGLSIPVGGPDQVHAARGGTSGR